MKTWLKKVEEERSKRQEQTRDKTKENKIVKKYLMLLIPTLIMTINICWADFFITCPHCEKKSELRMYEWSSTWQCDYCGQINDEEETQCRLCGNQKTFKPRTPRYDEDD